MPALMLFATLILLSRSSHAAEPIVVRNSDKPLWGHTHRIEFIENLRIGGEGADDEVFGSWVMIAADSKGRIIVADRQQNQVNRFSPAGEPLGPVGRGGEGPGEYANLWAVATDPKDNIYVASQGRVSLFDPSASFVSEFRDESHGMVNDVLVLSDGTLLLSEYDYPTQTTLQKYVDGKHIAHFSEVHRFPDEVAHHMQGFLGGSACMGPDGMIYYSQRVPYEIRKFTATGDLKMRVFRENDFVTPPKLEQTGEWTKISGWCGSYEILALPDGKLLNVILGVDFTVLDLFDSDGRLLLIQRSPLFHPQWLDARSNVYFRDRMAGSVVRSSMVIH